MEKGRHLSFERHSNSIRTLFHLSSMIMLKTTHRLGESKSRKASIIPNQSSLLVSLYSTKGSASVLLPFTGRYIVYPFYPRRCHGLWKPLGFQPVVAPTNIRHRYPNRSAECLLFCPMNHFIPLMTAVLPPAAAGRYAPSAPPPESSASTLY